MEEQIFYEDVNIGDEIPVLVKHPSTRQLVKWSGATEAWTEIHYDKDYALSVGLPGVVVPGWLICTFLGQLITDWIGKRGTLVKLGCSFRGLNFPGEDLICRGKVTKKYTEGSQPYVEAKIWAENSKGEMTTPGLAVVILPSRV
jgi:acyl dehydratase